MSFVSRIRGYIWTLLSLATGLILGGMFPGSLAPVAKGTEKALELFIAIVPLLIVFALGPAISKLAVMGKGGRLASGVIFWYLLTSSAAGLLGLIISSLLFDIRFSSNGEDMFTSAVEIFTTFNGQAGASLPLLAILFSVIVGLAAARLSVLQKILSSIDCIMVKSTPFLSVIMPFAVLCLGVTLGVNTGASASFKYYILMTLYTFGLCLIWWAIYVFVILKVVAGQDVRKILTVYYLPTAVFAAGTCSSLATLPVNLANVKKIGVSDHIGNFVIPIGAVINLDTSALAYVAYAPFVLRVVFDLPITWSALLVAWPAIVVFTIAAPGLPAGMGTALWSSTLFAALLGLTGEVKTEFITTWIALSGGLPDMFRTATNCTGDGFTAILFDTFFKPVLQTVRVSE